MEKVEVVELTDAELNKILLEDFGKRKILSEMGRVPFMLKFMVKRMMPLPRNIKELNLLYQQSKYEEAYNVLQRLRMTENKAKWYIDCSLIVLCYFRLEKFEEAKNLIEGMNYITYSLPQVIMSIASKVGAKYIPGNVARSSN